MAPSVVEPESQIIRHRGGPLVRAAAAIVACRRSETNEIQVSASALIALGRRVRKGLPESVRTVASPDVRIGTLPVSRRALLPVEN